jgi:hypothetical protein
LEHSGNVYNVMSYTKDCHWVLSTFIAEEKIHVVK